MKKTAAFDRLTRCTKERNCMEEQNLAKLLYEFSLSPEHRAERDSEEGQKQWASLIENLTRDLEISGCGAAAETYLYSRPGEQVCGYRKDYGYFLISCGDRGDCLVEILKEDAVEAENCFLEYIVNKRAYEWALKGMEREEARWTYHCRYDYRLPWFKKALEWLVPVVDWAFFAQCADRYVALLNRHFAQPH